MMIGMLVIDLFHEQCHSLKDKRQLLTSLKKRLHNTFNIAVAESDCQELWQQAQVSVVSLAAGRDILERTFKQIEDFIFLNYEVQITRMQVQYY
jgi:uncharacterized protein YlxP (DUF503 family)